MWKHLEPGGLIMGTECYGGRVQRGGCHGNYRILRHPVLYFLRPLTLLEVVGDVLLIIRLLVHCLSITRPFIVHHLFTVRPSSIHCPISCSLSVHDL